MLLSDVEDPLLKKEQCQHCEPENVTRNLGVKCLDYMSETIFLICWCPLQGRPTPPRPGRCCCGEPSGPPCAVFMMRCSTSER
jgi:hypothetical protein